MVLNTMKSYNVITATQADATGLKAVILEQMALANERMFRTKPYFRNALATFQSRRRNTHDFSELTRKRNRHP
jgi:hypothetical protein